MNAQSANGAADGKKTDGSVGERLKREREKKGLSIKQAADNLNLDTGSIEALEEERFAALGPPVFVKGHLQRYATLLQLDCASLVAVYESQQESGPALTPFSLAVKMVRPRKWKRTLLVAILVVLIIAAVVFWLTQR